MHLAKLAAGIAVVVCRNIIFGLMDMIGGRLLTIVCRSLCSRRLMFRKRSGTWIAHALNLGMRTLLKRRNQHEAEQDHGAERHGHATS